MADMICHKVYELLMSILIAFNARSNPYLAGTLVRGFILKLLKSIQFIGIKFAFVVIWC
jgi:hypothetical protein